MEKRAVLWKRTADVERAVTRDRTELLERADKADGTVTDYAERAVTRDRTVLLERAAGVRENRNTRAETERAARRPPHFP